MQDVGDLAALIAPPGTDRQGGRSSWGLKSLDGYKGLSCILNPSGSCGLQAPEHDRRVEEYWIPRMRYS